MSQYHDVFSAHQLYQKIILIVLRWQMFSQKINSLPSQAVMGNAGVLRVLAYSTCNLIFSASNDKIKNKINTLIDNYTLVA